MAGKLKSFDRLTACSIQDRALKLLAPLIAELGIAIKAAPGKYDATTMDLRFTAVLVNADGIAETPERQAFRKYAPMYGIDPNAIDQEIEYGGCIYRLTGLRLSAGKYPLQAIRLDNSKSYRLPLAAAPKRAA